MSKVSSVVRLLTLGDSESGKSSIVMRFAMNEFSTDNAATIGIDFRTRKITVDNMPVQVQLWDSAGHEKFRTITRNYFRGAKGILLVYDITNRASFINLDKWYDDILIYSEPGIPVILLGNKSDKEGSRQVFKEEGEKFAIERGFAFLEVSASTGDNINSAIGKLCSMVLKNQIPDSEIENILDLSLTDLSNTFQSSSCCWGR